MELHRRSAIALGVTVAATPIIAFSGTASAAHYAADEGKEMVPGIRLVELGTRDSMIPAFKTIVMFDLVFAPGAVFPEAPMDHDMVCQVTEGELQIKQGDIEFTVSPGDVYSCGKGTPEQATNSGGEVAVMRVIELHA